MDATRTHTVEEMERTPPPGDWELDDWELIDGTLSVVPAAGARASATIVQLACLVGTFVSPQHLGSLYMRAGFKMFPDRETLLGPSFAFVDRDRMPDREPAGFFRLPPDLAIDVIGPFRTVAWALRRSALYLEAGVPLVWIVDPVAEAISVMRPDRLPVVLGVDGTLNGGDVISGFSAQAAKVFD